jgi:hypothetical protein
VNIPPIWLPHIAAVNVSDKLIDIFLILYVQVTVHRDNLHINNQQDVHQVSKILFFHKTLHVSGIYCSHHQELSAVHVAIGMFHAGYVAVA